MFSKRLITSLFLIALSLVAVFLFPAWGFIFVLAFFIFSGLDEFYRIVQRKIPVFRQLGLICAVALLFFIYFGAARFPSAGEFSLLFFTFCFFFVQLSKKENQNGLLAVVFTLFGLIYIAYFLSFFIRIRLFPEGQKLIGFVLLVTKSADIGAYIVGKLFGKHKWIVRLSPQKTLEGTLGGFCFSLFFALYSKTYLPNFSFFHLAFLGCLLGFLSIFGDLCESLMKREFQIKDASQVLPGLGGVLDVVDSLIFAVPAFYFYLRIFLGY
jgi:phosphatidate cytidylyltransferase